MLTPSEDDIRLLSEAVGHVEKARVCLQKLGNRLDSRFANLDLRARNALVDAHATVHTLKKQVEIAAGPVKAPLRTAEAAGAVPGQKPLAQAFKPA